jgi:hypothetical protein
MVLLVPEPVPPAAPVLTPCPERWTEQAGGGGPVTCEPGPPPDWSCPDGWSPRALLAGTPQRLSICEPPPLPPDCGAGTTPALGSASCVHLGDPCPEGEWPVGLPASTVLFVRAGENGGDGTEGAPFGSLAGAVASAAPGTIIAIAKGTYPEAVEAKKLLTLWGACAEGVRIVGPPGELEDGTVFVDAPGALTLRNLTVGGERSGIVVAGGELEAHGVRVSEATGLGIAAFEGTLRLGDIVISGTRPLSNGTWGKGLQVEDGTNVVVERALIEKNRTAGVYAAGPGSLLVLQDVVVRDTAARVSDGKSGVGLDVRARASVTVRRALVQDNRDAGILVREEGSVVSLEDVIVRRTEGREIDDLFGLGLDVEGGGRATVERSVFEGNREIGVAVGGKGSELVIASAAVLGTRGSAKDGTLGWGLSAAEGARATVARALLEGNATVGISAASPGTILDLADCVVASTRPRESDQYFGRGMVTVDGAQATVARTLFAANRDVGVTSEGAGTSLDLTDVIVRDTDVDTASKSDGGAIVVAGGGGVCARRLVLERNHGVGVLAGGAGTSLDLADVIVRDTLADLADVLGRGLEVQAGASVTLSRGLFERNRDQGILIAEHGTTADLSDIVVQDTHGRGDGRFGHAITFSDGSRAHVTRAELGRSHDVGVLVRGEGTELDGIDLHVTDTAPRESGGKFGRGLEVSFGARATLERTRIEGSHDRGIVVGRPGSLLVLGGSSVLGTLPDFRGESGVGIDVSDGATLEITSSRVAESHVAGILVQKGSHIVASSIEVSLTRAGSFTLLGPDGLTEDGPHHDGVGDGILVVGGSSAELDHVRADDNVRAGILFSDASGSLHAVTAEGNAIGLALQGTPHPSYDELTCDFSANERPLLSDGHLPVPDAPPPLGDPP